METPYQKISLLGLTVNQIAEHITQFGEPAYRAKQIYKWLHHHNVDDFKEMTPIPKTLRNHLAEQFLIKTSTLVKREIAEDGTEKYLWELQDGKRIESIMIPEASRTTTCISSQVGCSLGCRFCATGQMGLIRNLNPGEIIEQVLQIQKISRRKVTNIVFMGMGEPFLNYPRVIQASRIMGNPEGVAVANKRITISTSGIVPRIYLFSDEQHPFSLAISLHAPAQSLRRQLMPIAEKFPLEELIKSARYYVTKQKRKRITFEYILLDGINDSPAEARALKKLLSPIRCKLNLIPCNQTELEFRAPSEERIQRFMSILATAPFTLTLRRNRGQEINAACGQLFIKTTAEKKRRFIQRRTILP